VLEGPTIDNDLEEDTNVVLYLHHTAADGYIAVVRTPNANNLPCSCTQTHYVPKKDQENNVSASAYLSLQKL